MLHKEEPDDDTNCSNRFHEEQLKDPALCPIMKYLSEGVLPEDTQVTAKIIVQASLYTMADGILYYTGQKKDGSCTLRLQEEINGGVSCWSNVRQFLRS